MPPLMNDASPANVPDFIFGHELELVVARMDGRADIEEMPPAEAIGRYSTLNFKTRLSRMAIIMSLAKSPTWQAIHRFSLKHMSSH